MSDNRPLVAAENVLAARKIAADFLDSAPPFPNMDYARDAIRHLDRAAAYLTKCTEGGLVEHLP